LQRGAMAEAQDSEELVQCMRCGRMVALSQTQGPWHNNYTCNPCNALHSRIKRLSKHVEFDMSFATSEDRAKFYQNHEHTCGKELKATMTTTTFQSTEQEEREKFSKESNWLDEIDVLEKYAGKPEQAQNVLANAERFFHPVRKVTLYYDVLDKLVASHEDIGKSGKKRELDSEDVTKHKKEKKPKVEEEDGEAKREKTPKDERPLSDNARKQLESAGAKACLALERFRAFEETLRLTLRAGLVLELQAAMEGAKVATDTEGWAGPWKDLASGMKDSTKALSNLGKVLKGMLEVAKQMQGGA